MRMFRPEQYVTLYRDFVYWSWHLPGRCVYYPNKLTEHLSWQTKNYLAEVYMNSVQYVWKTYCNERKRDITCGATQSQELMTKLRSEVGERWRCKDDDGVVYGEGIIVGDYNGFEPLDDYYGPDQGAVSIEYYNPTTEEWSVL